MHVCTHTRYLWEPAGGYIYSLNTYSSLLRRKLKPQQVKLAQSAESNPKIPPYHINQFWAKFLIQQTCSLQWEQSMGWVRRGFENSLFRLCWRALRIKTLPLKSTGDTLNSQTCYQRVLCSDLSPVCLVCFTQCPVWRPQDCSALTWSCISVQLFSGPGAGTHSHLKIMPIDFFLF